MALIPALKKLILGNARMKSQPSTLSLTSGLPPMDKASPVPVPRMPQERPGLRMVGGIPMEQPPSRNKRIPIKPTQKVK